MPQPRQPSDIYRAFTWPRLMAIAKIMFDARFWAANDAKPERGDSRCGIGFRAWEHTKFAVAKAAANDLIGWLSIIDGGATFLFQLDKMPIKFLRGDSEEPLPPKYAIADARELVQTELAFEEAGQPRVEGIFRFVVHADAQGFPMGIYLVHADLLGNTLMTWQIPIADEAGGTAPIVVPQTPVILPDLEVESVEEAAERMAREQAERERAEQLRKQREKEKGA